MLYKTQRGLGGCAETNRRKEFYNSLEMCHPREAYLSNFIVIKVFSMNNWEVIDLF